MAALELPPRVIAADASLTAPAMHLADGCRRVPPCTQADFVPRLVEVCGEENVKLLIPTIDTELPLLADAREVFERAGTVVHVSAPSAIAIAADKRETHRWLRDRSFPTVDQVMLEQLLSGAARLEFPLIVKPACGSSSIGLRRVDSTADLVSLPVRNEPYVAQSIAPGVEYTVDVLVDRNGRCVSAVPRRRLEVRAGEVSKGVTVRVPSVIDLAVRVAEALPGAWGVLNIQIFHDSRSDVLNVIELNARFGGGFPLTWEAGGHFPVWIMQEALGLRSTAHGDFREGLVMLRYDTSVFRDKEACGL